jgi:CTP-dependent riboflavin kinase
MPGGVLSEQFFIERTISKNGQSKIKIMDSDRKFLSKATSDLHAIRQVRESV